jgi:hypothetical protein
MGDFDPSATPAGLSIEAVDWLPSGGRSGLVRVRGRWDSGPEEIPLPQLLIGGERFDSLPDPRATRERGAWRGAYVVPSEPVEAGDARLALEFPGGVRIALPRPSQAFAPPSAAGGAEVVDRAVLADRRARRAEAAEQAQARIAREALKAVEVLELRAAELEDRLAAAQQERDTLREVPLSAVPDQAPAPSERLREALGAAIATVGDLRLQLHEARVRGRTGEIARAADSVRLAVLGSERSSVVAEVHALRLRVAEADAQLVQRAAELEQAQARGLAEEAAHATTRAELAAQAGELRDARAAIARLEADLEASRAEAQRLLAEELPAAVASARAADARAFAEKEAAAAAALEVARSESAAALAAARGESAAGLEAARAEVERVEAALSEAETARSVAEAEAAGARSRAQAADVARVSLTALHGNAGKFEELSRELIAARAEIQAQAARLATTAELAAELERFRAELADERATAAGLRSELAAAAAQSAEDGAVMAALTAEIDASASRAATLVEQLAAERERKPAPPPVPAALPERAAEQESAAAAVAPAPDRERMVADLAAAADALRARTPEPEAEPEPEPEPEPAGPKIISAGEPPRSVATGSEARDYPALRGALVKLAHDDPAAAARLLAGLLPAQWRVLDEPVDYDITIAEAGTFACTVTAGGANVRPLAGARGRSEAEFHLRADALTLAEMLAGHGPRPRRFGRAKVTGRARRAKLLQPAAGATISLPDAVRAGADLEPELVLRTLAYAVHPSWTKGHEFTIAHTFTGPEGDQTLYITAAGSRGLRVSHDAPDDPPRATVVLTRAAFRAMLRGDAPEPGERPATRGDHRAAQTLRAWADRARAGS